MNSSFKHSGITWLGEVPSNWKIIALKRSASYISRGRSPDYTDDKERGIPIINQACIYWDGLRLENVKWQDPDTSNGHRGKLCFGDLLINSTGTGTLGRVGVFNLSNEYLADSHITIIRPTKELSAKYLYYLLQTDVYQGYIYSVLASGATNQIELSRDGLSNTPIIFPLLKIQEIIAHFLDRKTAAIDTLIAIKQRLIQLLEEKRTALINQAVTKGLNPNVPMKDSGIPWIGDIPEHWKAKLFRRVTSRIDVGIAEAATHAYVEQGVPIIRSANVRTNYVDMSNLAFIQKEFAEKNRSKYIHSGDILTVRTGANAGMTAVVPQELNHVQCFTLLIATPVRQQNSQFYSYYINAPFAQSFFAVEGWGSAQVNLSVPILKELPIVEPSYQEQEEIVTFIKSSTKTIDELIYKNRQQIDKLQEYRRSLITAAVTGKLEVGEGDAA